MASESEVASFEVAGEYAAVTVSLDASGHGAALRLHDQRTGRARRLDPLELECLTWSTPEDLAPLLDPARTRWNDTPDVVSLVQQIYPALASGDRPALEALLAEDFVSHLATGLPAPIGGSHRGRAAAIADGWWAIGRRFAVAAEPEEWHRSGLDRLVVVGRYRGRHRRGDATVDAAFVHVWRAAAGVLVELQQVTDTVEWGLGGPEGDA